MSRWVIDTAWPHWICSQIDHYIEDIKPWEASDKTQFTKDYEQIRSMLYGKYPPSLLQNLALTGIEQAMVGPVEDRKQAWVQSKAWLEAYGYSMVAQIDGLYRDIALEATELTMAFRRMPNKDLTPERIELLTRTNAAVYEFLQGLNPLDNDPWDILHSWKREFNYLRQDAHQHGIVCSQEGSS
jgi:hypothetical protein